MNTHILKEGEEVARKSMITIFFLGILKLAGGLLTGMTVLIADAISSFADLLGVFASYIGLRLSRKTADSNFKYGYHKVETFAAFLVSLGLIYLGYRVMRQSVQTLLEPAEGHLIPFAITTTIIGIVFSFRLYKKLIDAGEKTNSLSLILNAKDKKMDAFIGVAVLLSIVANYKQIPYVEGAVSILISLIILKEGLFSSKEALFFLLDYWDDPKLTKKIKKVLKKEDGLVLKVKKLRLRRAGTYIFGEAFIEINPFAGFKDLREELDILKKKIIEINPYIKDFAIFTDISQAKKTIVALPIKDGKDMAATLATNLKNTKAYLFATLKSGKVTAFHIKKLREKDKTPIELADFLNSEKVNILIDNDLSSLVYFNLRRMHHVRIYPNFPDIKNVKNTIDLLLLDT